MAPGACYDTHMSRSIVRTAQAPAAIGPYSQAVVVPVGDKRMVFCSGQIALDPKTGTVIEGDVAAQTRQVLENLGAVLAASPSMTAPVFGSSAICPLQNTIRLSPTGTTTACEYGPIAAGACAVRTMLRFMPRVLTRLAAIGVDSATAQR